MGALNMAYFIEPRAVAIFVLVIEVISGRIGFLLTHRTKFANYESGSLNK